MPTGLYNLIYKLNSQIELYNSVYNLGSVFSFWLFNPVCTFQMGGVMDCSIRYIQIGMFEILKLYGDAKRTNGGVGKICLVFIEYGLESLDSS